MALSRQSCAVNANSRHHQGPQAARPTAGGDYSARRL